MTLTPEVLAGLRADWRRISKLHVTIMVSCDMFAALLDIAERVCPECDGYGRADGLSLPCDECSGTGWRNP